MYKFLVGFFFALFILDNACASQQEITFPELVSEDPGAISIEIPFTYNTNPVELKTTGLEINVFFDSSRLTFSGLANLYEDGLQSQFGLPSQVHIDDQDEDGSLTTDSRLIIAYKSSNGTWPSVDHSQQGLKLFDLVFRAPDPEFMGQSPINVIVNNYENESQVVSANGSLRQNYLNVCFDCFSLDIDGNGTLDPLTDGILFFRYLLRISGELLVQNLLLTIENRDEPSELFSYLNVHSARLDIDGDGDLSALTDGVLVLRYLYDIRGNALIESALGDDAKRSSPEEIEAYIAARLGTGTVNRPPVFDSFPGTVEIEENQVVVTTISAEDPDGDALNYAIAGDDSEYFVITNVGELSFIDPPNFEVKSFYTIDVSVSDSDYQITGQLDITILDVEETPRINNLPFSITVLENQKSILTVSASDPNGDGLSFSISGNDASNIEVSSAGVLTFLEAPDFEIKRQYNVIVDVSDGENAASQSLRINIDDVNETPTSITLTSSSVTENIAGAIVGNVTVTDPEADPVTLTLGGSESQVFEILGSELKLKSDTWADYEDKSSYSITIEARDSADNTIVSGFVIEVLDVDETIANPVYGSSGDDILIGGSGNDAFHGASGSDALYGQPGDDTFYLSDKADGFVDTINGGSGSDTLVISYSGVSSLGDFAIAYDSSSEYFTLSDSNSGTVSFKSIESLVIGSYTYIENTTDDTYWNASEYILYMYDGGNTSSSGITSLSGFSASSNLTVIGSSSGDSMNLNIDRSSDLTGSLIVTLGAGDDSLNSAKLKNADSIDLGSGDDTAYLMIGGSNGTPTLADASFTKLDGGAGTDILAFTETSGSNGQTLSLSIGGAVNFENLIGSGYNEILQGDANANAIAGDGGADELYGLAGDDRLAAGGYGVINAGDASSILNSINDSNNNDNDALYGGAGNDTLYGSAGDNTLDGGTGTDTIYSGNGSDTIVIRSGDGGTTLAEADIVTDYSDGNDIIGLSGIGFDDLTIAQGTGDNSSHTLVSYSSSGEYLVVLQNVTATSITALDFASTSTSNQTLSGTNGNNTLIGGAGNDTLTTGTGTDVLLASAGNDTITVDGLGNKTIDGGAGTDSLTISISGVTSLSNYTISTSGDYAVLTDSDGNAIQYKNVESLIIGSYTYIENTTDDTYWNASEYILYMYDGGNTSSSGITSLSGFSASSNLTVIGSSSGDSMNLNIDRSSDLTGSLIVTLGAGDDSLNSAKLKNADSIDLGSGDDTAYLMIGGSNGTPTLADASFTKLDGGAGTDILAFTETSGSNGQTLSLSIGGAVNFENLIGSGYNEILQGDANANAIAGDGGADELYGLAGDDRLAAGGYGVINAGDASSILNSINDSNNNDNDALYGGAGNDTLYGSAGDNTLDGGTGTDTIYSGNGSDTIVIRSGDGGTTLAEADIVTDYSDGSDVLGLDNDLTYSDLTISQGTGSYASDTVLKLGSEFLLILKNISAQNITAIDFTEVTIDESLASSEIEEIGND